MSDWFNTYTVVAFILGVLLCQMVRAQFANLRSKL